MSKDENYIQGTLLFGKGIVSQNLKLNTGNGVNRRLVEAPRHRFIEKYSPKTTYLICEDRR